MIENFVIGLGQIGRPLQKILGCEGWDAQDRPIGVLPTVRFLHICFPYSETFTDHVINYARRCDARHVVVHATVLPGTTRTIQRELLSGDAPSRCGVAYSPVRGRHGDMERDMMYFTKFVASENCLAASAVAACLAAAGFKVQIHPDPTALELSKIFQTTATGVQVAFAQEMARYCGEIGVDFMDAQALLDTPNLPHVTHQPGFIGGHCIIQNLDFLDAIRHSQLVEWIDLSNEMQKAKHGREEERLYPIPLRQYV